ncbi:MAG: hypothetical protein MJ132_02945 [Clostridia bacterium]|nr:hypothetical protein [Clostridia bacterium]
MLSVVFAMALILVSLVTPTAVSADTAAPLNPLTLTDFDNTQFKTGTVEVSGDMYGWLDHTTVQADTLLGSELFFNMNYSKECTGNSTGIFLGKGGWGALALVMGSANKMNLINFATGAAVTMATADQVGLDSFVGTTFSVSLGLTAVNSTDVSVVVKINETVIDTVVIANAASWFAAIDRNNGTLMLYAPDGGLTVSAYEQPEEPEENKGKLLYPINFTSGTQTATVDGTVISCNGWVDYNFSGITYSAENKLHVFMKNTADVPVAVLLDWARPDECYNKDGQAVSTADLHYLPADGETYELVFSTAHNLQFNLHSEAAASVTVEGYYVGTPYTFDGEFQRFNILNEGDRTGGAGSWNTTSFEAITKTKETHIFVKNRVNCPDAPHKTIFQLNWAPADDIKQVTGTNGTTEISGGTTLLDPDWKVYELIYNAQESGDWNEFNICWASDANEIEIYGYYQVEPVEPEPEPVVDLKIGTQTKGNQTRLIMKLCGDAETIEAYETVGFKLTVDGVEKTVDVDCVYDSFYNGGNLVTATDLGCTYVAILEIGSTADATSITAQGVVNGTVFGAVRTLK